MMSVTFLLRSAILVLGVFGARREWQLGGRRVVAVDTHEHFRYTTDATVPSEWVPLRDARGGVVKSAALTFDCAYVPVDRGLAVADALRDMNVKSTFFIAGPFVFGPNGKAPNTLTLPVIRRLIDDGHEFANHTKGHPHVGPGVDYAAELRELERGWNVVLRTLYGETPPPNARMLPYWRAPFGEYDERALRAAAGEGYAVHMGWHVDLRDALGTPACRDRAIPGCLDAARQTAHFLAFETRRADWPVVVALAHLGAPYHYGDEASGIRASVSALRQRGRRLVRLSEVAPLWTAPVTTTPAGP